MIDYDKLKSNENKMITLSLKVKDMVTIIKALNPPKDARYPLNMDDQFLQELLFSYLEQYV